MADGGAILAGVGMLDGRAILADNGSKAGGKREPGRRGKVLADVGNGKVGSCVGGD
jgi:hypothetical protein